MLGPDAAASYHRDGFVQGGALVTASAADDLLAQIDHIVQEPAHPAHHSVFDMGLDGQPLQHLKNIWLFEPAFAAVLAQPSLAQALYQLTGRRRFRLWQDGFFRKPAEIGSAHGWHQDLVYLPVETGAVGIATWLALTDVSSPNDGAMGLVRGSHRWGDASGLLDTLPEPQLGRPLEVPGRGHLDIEYATMKRGEVHFHHGLVWHGSVANVGAGTRCGLLLFFLDADDRLSPDHPYASRYEEAATGQFDDRLHPVIAYEGPDVLSGPT